MSWFLNQEKNKAKKTNNVYNLPPMHLNCANWVAYAIDNFYKQIFYDVLAVTNGLSNKQKSIMYNNSSVDYRSKYGLIHYLVEGYTSGNHFALQLVENEGRPFVKKINSYNLNNDDILKNGIVRVDFQHFSEPAQMRQLFYLQYNVLQYIHAGISVSATPTLKISDLRKANTTSNKEALQKQVAEIGQSFTSAGQIITLDGGDSIDFSSFDALPAEKLNDIIIGLMSTVTRLPKSYIGANRSSSLGDSGLADDKQFFKSISRYFNEIFKPVTDQILGTDVTFSTTTRDRITWQLDALNQLDTVENIDDQQRQLLLFEILNAR